MVLEVHCMKRSPYNIDIREVPVEIYGGGGGLWLFLKKNSLPSNIKKQNSEA